MHITRTRLHKFLLSCVYQVITKYRSAQLPTFLRLPLVWVCFFFCFIRFGVGCFGLSSQKKEKEKVSIFPHETPAGRVVYEHFQPCHDTIYVLLCQGCKVQQRAIPYILPQIRTKALYIQIQICLCESKRRNTQTNHTNVKNLNRDIIVEIIENIYFDH